MTDTLVRGIPIGTVGGRVRTRSFMRRKSMIAFLFALPLIAIVAI